MIFTESPVYVWSLTTFSVPQSTLALYFYFSLAFRYRVRDTLTFFTSPFLQLSNRSGLPLSSCKPCDVVYISFVSTFNFETGIFRQFEGSQNSFQWRFKKYSRITGSQNLSLNSIRLLFRHSFCLVAAEHCYPFEVTDDDHITARLNQNIS